MKGLVIAGMVVVALIAAAHRGAYAESKLQAGGEDCRSVLIDKGICGEPLIAMGPHHMGHGDHSGHNQDKQGGAHDGHSGSKEKGVSSTQSGHEGHDHGGEGGAKSWDGMSVHFIPMMQSITGMSQKVSDMMKKGMSAGRMKELSEIMDGLSAHMGEMSTMMFLGSATEGDMHELHMKINDTGKRLGDIR